MIRGMTQQTDVPDAETIPVTRAEKIAGWVALGCLALLGLFCFDLATGGALSRRLGGRGETTGNTDEPEQP
jgi:hypothetical protein